MADKVLYFPYIRVPRNEWFSRVLLYWDEVGAIVPSEYQRERIRLGHYMKELVDSGLVKEVVPANYTSTVPNFKDTFLHMIDNNEVIDQRRDIALERHETVKIHLEKMIGEGLIEDLSDRGLASLADYPWWEVETLTGNLFMGYLASVLGKLDQLRMAPMTDRADSLSVFSKTPEDILNVDSLIDQLRMSVLEDILPGPSQNIPVGELIDFKQTHSDLLGRFRRNIEAFLLDISPVTQENIRRERIRLFKADSRERIDEIHAKMREKRWPRIVLGGICGILAAAIPGILALAKDTPLLATAAVPGLVSATYAAFSSIPDQQKRMLREPLAYAAFAQERFLPIG